MTKKRNFIQEFMRIINLIAETIEHEDVCGNINVDLNGDILNITTEQGVFVINKQSFTKEIWLSSPISGPHHFSYDGKIWRSKAGLELFELLSTDLNMSIKDSHD